VRLHPSIPNEKIAIEYIQEQERNGVSMRQLFVDLVLYRLNMTPEEAEESIGQVDARRIMQTLKDMMKRMKQGFIAQGTAEGLAASEALEGATDEFIETFDRFVDMGMSADDLEDDDGN
jgi:hypothetical protein